ncbi:MAG: hypothetical protein JKX80_01005 [Candidatus Pacebacteria bacterium]|nr:hypothetical protein [Candidatus Paceibacterota bacterium]
MNYLKTITHSFITVFVLAALLGGVSTYTLTLYNKTINIKELQTAQGNIGSYKRFVRIENIDVERNLIGAITIDRDVYQVQRMLFSITDATKIERQNTLVENGIVVGFTPVEQLSITDLEVNEEIIVRLLVSSSGKLVANNIVLGILSSN